MHIERIVYPKLGIIDEIEVEEEDKEPESETTAEKPSNKEKE